MRRIAIVLFVLSATSALAAGDAWTDNGGTTYFQNNDGSGAIMHSDAVGQQHIQTYDGRQGTVWRDGGGVTHYEGDAFSR